MNRQFFAGVAAIIVATVCISAPECSAWEPPLYIDSDWKVYAPVGEYADVEAWVDSGGPVSWWQWDWDAGGYQGQSDSDYSSFSWGQYSSSGVYSAYVDAYSAGGSDDAHSYVYAVAVTQVISSTSATCVGQNVTFGAITNPLNCAPYVTVTWSGGGTPSTGSGSQFTTNWSTPGTKTVTAACGTSTAQKDVTVVAVASVNVNKTIACVGEAVTFTANSNPSGKPISCIEWQKRYRPNSSSSWGSWGSASGGDNTAILSTTTAGLYQYRARNGSADTWKESSEVTVVGVAKLQYYNYESQQWLDVSGTMYVPKSDFVKFRAVPSPSGATWPSGKPVWGGTAGASGTGEEKVVTFSTMSSSSSDYKTVSAECGDTIQVSAIVYDFAGTLSPLDSFTGRSLTQYGLEEVVDLTCDITPTGLTAGQIGGLQWDRLTGVGTLSGVTSSGAADYDAGASAGGVTLILEVLSGPCEGAVKSYVRSVIAPSGTRMTRVNPNNVWHIQGHASAGIALYYWLDPTNVSFKYLTFGEGSCPATGATGIYVADPPGNHAQNYFGNILGGSSTTGCRVELMDGPKTDRYPWAPGGTFTWGIPSEYVDDTTTRHSFGTQNHVATIDPNGYTTMSKGGQSGSAAVNAPTSGW